MANYFETQEMHSVCFNEEFGILAS